MKKVNYIIPQTVAMALGADEGLMQSVLPATAKGSSEPKEDPFAGGGAPLRR